MKKEWVKPWNRKEVATAGAMNTVIRNAVIEPSTCPWCGLAKKVYVRAGSELVCTDCVEVFEASEGSD